MLAGLVDFLEGKKTNSFHDRQYGFRSGRFCGRALLDAQNTLGSLKKKCVLLLLLIDLSKADS